jgi:DNA-binding GntR family transcriptional regulator
LSVAPGAALLRIDRIAYALDDRAIEWRVSLCHLENAHYIARTRLSRDSGGR